MSNEPPTIEHNPHEKRRHGPTYSPGEKIWIGIYLAFMCIAALIIF